MVCNYLRFFLSFSGLSAIKHKTNINDVILYIHYIHFFLYHFNLNYINALCGTDRPGSLFASVGNQRSWFSHIVYAFLSPNPAHILTTSFFFFFFFRFSDFPPGLSTVWSPCTVQIGNPPCNRPVCGGLTRHQASFTLSPGSTCSCSERRAWRVGTTPWSAC
jgi:hypothetical protein